MSIKPNRHPPPGPAGNTQGLIVPQTAPHASGAGNPAPEPHPEAETQGWWKRWGSDVAHGALDVVGLIPVLGEAADGLNAVIYVAEGDYVSAALSAAAMLPVGGQAATAAKFGKKAAEAGIDASRQAAKQGAKQAGKEAAERGVRQTGKEAAEEGAGQAGKKAGAGGGGKRNDGGYVEGKKKGVCKALAFKIYALAPEVAKRFMDMMKDKLGLFKLTVKPDGTRGVPHPSLPKGSGTWHGHEQQLKQKQKNLRDDILAYDANKCRQPKIPKSIRDLAYVPVPKSPGGTPSYPLTHIPN